MYIEIISNKKLNPITKDSRGTNIEKGLKVAYNKSGDVVLGHIDNLEKNVYNKVSDGYYRLNFKLRIIDENGSVSYVKNPNSFVVI